MSNVIPFPQNQRRPFIAKHAARMASLPVRTAEKHLTHALKVQTETMTRRGIEGGLIEAEMKSLETAIRAHLWKIIIQGESAS